MANTDKTNITSSSYKDMFEDNSYKTNNTLGVIVIVCLFSILTGILGYYVGDRGLGAKFFNSNTFKRESTEATIYTDEELSKLVNSGSYDMNLYKQVIANLKEKYVDAEKVKDNELFNGSLKGMVDSIGDKATTYFSAKEYQEYKSSFSGRYEGIGVRMEYQNNQVVVIDVMPNSPAEKADVREGYIFYKVDGTDISTNSIEDIVAKVKGEAGTAVKIVFIDPLEKVEVEKDIVRAPITVESMRLVEKSPDTVVFEVTRFTEDSLDKWKSLWDKNVSEINAKGYKNVVLDLRGNGGGYLDAAIYAANDFLEPDKLIVSEKSRIRPDKDTKSTNRSPRLKGKKVIFLVNNGTASASEILTAAVKYHNNIKVIGTKTFGKGTVQNTYDLPNGGAIKVTTEYWIMPTGKRLDNENPILPDREVKTDPGQNRKGEDSVLNEALKELSN
jgi:carboxyl-terminal processing protease